MKSSPKLGIYIESVSTCAEELSPLTTRSAAAAPSVRLRVYMSRLPPWGCRESCSRLAERRLLVLSTLASVRPTLIEMTPPLFVAAYRIFLQ